MSAEIDWRPAVREGERVEDLPLKEWVGQALGTASSCWSNLAGAGEFDSVRCGWVLDGLLAYLNPRMLMAAEVSGGERTRSVELTGQMRQLLDAAAGREHSAGGAVVRALQEILGLVEERLVVWAVVFSNYEPSEVDSLWSSRDAAKLREAELDRAGRGNWRVVPWSVSG